MDEFIGIVKLFAGNFAPYGWQFCWGQTLAISQYTALFSILGTTYGGNGTTTFMLPDLRGRVPVGAGAGLGLSPIVIGQVGGNENASILLNNMPSHNHTVTGSVQVTITKNNANVGNPTGAYLAVTTPNNSYNATANGTATLAGVTSTLATGLTGSGLPLPIRDPYLGMNYIICLNGLFPPRN